MPRITTASRTRTRAHTGARPRTRKKAAASSQVSLASSPARIPYLCTLSEEAFQDEILKEAAAQGWVVFHWPDSRRVTAKGHPDLFLVHFERMETLYWEIKKYRGRVKPDQKKMLAFLVACGYEARLVYPTDWDFIVARLAR